MKLLVWKLGLIRVIIECIFWIMLLCVWCIFRCVLLVRFSMCRFLISCDSFFICVSKLWNCVLLGVNMFLVSFCS